MPQHILLVDDDRLILSTLGSGLRQAGYTVIEAASGEAALAFIQHQQLPNLAILDIRMPGISGIELARRLQETHHIPTLFLSAYSDKRMVEDAIKEGGLGYIVKPVDIPQLVPAIEAALARAQDLKTLGKLKNQLEEALKKGRDTTTATGILMERQGLQRQEAFELLRTQARTQRRRLESLAREIIDAVETLNTLKAKR